MSGPTTPRAVENDVWFVRGNNVVLNKDSGLSYDGVGYGDSYVVDPFGEIVIRSRRHREDFIVADIDPAVNDKNWGVGRSLWSRTGIWPAPARRRGPAEVMMRTANRSLEESAGSHQCGHLPA